ncbi:MAG TPA: TonB-dependent receptor [Sphingobacteriaceae bacterium]
MIRFLFTLMFAIILASAGSSFSQSLSISGRVSTDEGPLEFASVVLGINAVAVKTDSTGLYLFSGILPGVYTLKASAVGYLPLMKEVVLTDSLDTVVDFYLEKHKRSLNEVVVTGTMKEVSRTESPVPVEVYSPAFFKKNPTPSVFEALQNVNGVRPQLNCNICNTGDIHINGLEGPYTMILIDGMPLVSGLSSVYGLSGIPNALIERVEIVKGPASSLYGSEAVGGLINIITRKPQDAPVFSGDIFTTSWEEINADIGIKLNTGKNSSALTGINYFKYGNRIDNDNDDFTDVTQADRISVFQKWNFGRKSHRLFSIAGRFNYEDRWGGDMGWDKSFRGGTIRYGESIYTNRWEFISNYQLPFGENLMLSFSYNDHDQNSMYGSTAYIARQKIAFSQLSWDKRIGKHDLLGGSALRYTFYNDNTPATITANKVWLPGIFVQDEISVSPRHKVLLGLRYDYNSAHGSILTPRLAYKIAFNDNNIVRLNAGTGFRVVSLFTEEHAALTGSRDVVITEQLAPERSYNANLNYIKKVQFSSGGLINIDASAWYTRFENQILPDYSDPGKIIYNNLQGYAVSRGISANADIVFANGLKVLAGGSLLDVFSVDANKRKHRQHLTERWTGTWSVSYVFRNVNLGIDYTGNVYGPMLLPRLGPDDPRSGVSPVWSLQNVQLTYSPGSRLEVYGGVKNLLNWTPGRHEPFLIARSHDPFNKHVQYDVQGNVLKTPENPYALTFDPGFIYAPNQGMRAFIGFRVNIK